MTTLEVEKEAMDAAAAAMHRWKHVDGGAELTLNNGAVIRCKPVPPLYIEALADEFREPAPPLVFIESKDREEENPNDPAYLRKLDELRRAHQIALVNLVLGIGTELVSVPDGVHPPESDEWVDEVRRREKFTHKAIPLPDLDDPDLRYIGWLRFYASDTNNDVALLGAIPQLLAGLREEEIRAAADSFRGIQGRRADSIAAVEPGSNNGDQPNRAARRRR